MRTLLRDIVPAQRHSSLFVKQSEPDEVIRFPVQVLCVFTRQLASCMGLRLVLETSDQNKDRDSRHLHVLHPPRLLPRLLRTPRPLPLPPLRVAAGRSGSATASASVRAVVAMAVAASVSLLSPCLSAFLYHVWFRCGGRYGERGGKSRDPTRPKLRAWVNGRLMSRGSHATYSQSLSKTSLKTKAKL